jgi:hypothetical protein
MPGCNAHCAQRSYAMLFFFVVTLVLVFKAGGTAEVEVVRRAYNFATKVSISSSDHMQVVSLLYGRAY